MTKKEQLTEFAIERLLVHFYHAPGKFIGYGKEWDQLWTDFVKYYNTGYLSNKWDESRKKLMLKVKIEIHEYYDTHIR